MDETNPPRESWAPFFLTLALLALFAAVLIASNEQQRADHWKEKAESTQQKLDESQDEARACWDTVKMLDQRITRYQDSLLP